MLRPAVRIPPQLRLDAALKHPSIPSTVAAAALATLGLSQTATAGELTWEGHYRARAELFDSLSLSNTNPNAEESQWSMDHRARLQPPTNPSQG